MRKQTIYIYIYIYMQTHTHTHTHTHKFIYVYIYIERERAREREGEKFVKRKRLFDHCFYGISVFVGLFNIAANLFLSYHIVSSNKDYSLQWKPSSKRW